MKTIRIVGVALVAASVIAGGCSRSSEPAAATPGVGERSGAAIDKAADKTADAARAAAVKTKEVTGKALEKSGELMEKAGESMDETGEKMQAK